VRKLAFGLIIVMVLALLLVTVTPVLAAKPGGTQEALLDAIVKGADLQLSRQGTYTNACGGSYGPPNVAQIDNTWEWVIASGNTCWNVGGISATGLLAAYERTRNEDYLDGAIAQGNTLVEKYDTIVTNDLEGAEWEDRPFSHDVEFLVRLSRDSKDHSYAQVAADWYSIITSNKTAVENADRYIDVRKSLAGWDLASQIRAALAVGENDYARGMAARLIERRTDWEGVLYGGWDYTNSSYGSLLWALHELGDNHATIDEYRQYVLSIQEDDGSWEDGDYQLTAYMMLGLSAVQGTGSRDALASAGAFLVSTQTQEGGWSYPPEYGEVNSEVLMALSALKVDEGLHKGKTDPQPGHGEDTGKHSLDPLP
jgi:hypothetical protein